MIMKTIQRHFVWTGLLLAGLATVGCDESANSGASDMDSLAAQLDQSKQAAAKKPRLKKRLRTRPLPRKRRQIKQPRKKRQPMRPRRRGSLPTTTK